MDNNRSIERLLFPCPEVDSSDYSAYSPVSPEEFMVMEQGFRDDSSHVCLFPYARLTKAGKAFIDIYVWDLMLYPYNYRRFIICEGYRLSEEEENAFLKYVRCACHCLGNERMRNLNARVMELLPAWHYIPYSADRLTEALRHMYFASHRSGAREILYKAGLCFIAANLDMVPSYNVIGTDPKTILGNGLPMKLLRILNQPAFFHKLISSEESVSLCRDVYKKYGGFIGRKLPSLGQWNYLEALYCNGGQFGGA